MSVSKKIVPNKIKKHCKAVAFFAVLSIVGTSSLVPKAIADRLADVTQWYAAMDGSDGTVALFSEQISVLRADHATRNGKHLSIHFIEHFEPKGSYVRGWNNSGQSFSWQVTVQEADSFYIDALILGCKNAILEVKSDKGNPLTFVLPDDGWFKHTLGKINVPAGTSTLTLRSTTASFSEMQLKSLELKPEKKKAAIDNDIVASLSSSDWINGKVGVMFQWGEWGGSIDGSASQYPDLYKQFDYSGFAEKISAMGADYVVWSPAWWRYWMPAPIKAVDEVQAGLTTKEDYLQKLINALKAQGIKFFIYYHAGHAAHKDKHNLKWWGNFWKAPQAGHYARKEGAITRWMNIIEEIGLRYKEDLTGWFFDDGSIYYPMPFHLVDDAIRAGHPDRYYAFNEWVDAQGPVISPYADMSFGNGVGTVGTAMHEHIDTATGKFKSGVWKGLYAHFMSPYPNGEWGILAPRTHPIANHSSLSTFKAQMGLAKSLNKGLSYAFLMWENGDMDQVSVDNFAQAKKGHTTAEDSGIINDTEKLR